MELEINTTFLFHHHFSESLNSLGQGPLPLPPRSAQRETKKMGLGYCRDEQRRHKDCLQIIAIAGSTKSMQEILNIYKGKIVTCSF